VRESPRFHQANRRCADYRERPVLRACADSNGSAGTHPIGRASGRPHLCFIQVAGGKANFPRGGLRRKREGRRVLLHRGKRRRDRHGDVAALEQDGKEFGMKTMTLKGMGGLHYVEVRQVPYMMSPRKDVGKVIQPDLGEIEKRVASEIIRQQVPLRGQEVNFLRKALGLSMEKFAVSIGLTAASVLKWERTRNKRLAPINEAAVRSLVAEKLGIDIPGKFSSLVGAKESPRKLTVIWGGGSQTEEAA
jgi:DNA-binding transcriptional regulator YiaG